MCIRDSYWDGEKEKYYGKRFLIENPDKEETFISDHPDSQLELVSTDYRPVVEMMYYKARGKDQKPNDSISMEDFIAVKGIRAQGNHFYGEKLKQLNWLDSLPYEEEVVEEVAQEEETVVESTTPPTNTPKTDTTDKGSGTPPSDEDVNTDDEGQITLF